MCFKPRRLILTSPARPAADSRLVKEITATVKAKTRSDHFGALPKWIGSSSVWGLKNNTSPITTMNSCSTRSPTTSSPIRSEEHTSELQSLRHLVCRLLLEKKKNNK